MTYAMMKKTTNWMPLVHHKRSQKTRVLTLSGRGHGCGCGGCAHVDFLSDQGEFGTVQPAGERVEINSITADARCPFQLHHGIGRAAPKNDCLGDGLRPLYALHHWVMGIPMSLSEINAGAAGIAPALSRTASPMP